MKKNISRQKQYLSFYNINHGTILEIVWTLIPSFILFAIAIPSFALLYSMEEIFQPQDTSYIWIKPNEKNISRQKQYLSFYNINHGTILEIVWTLIPSFILFAIAIPSFALLYSMEEIFQPQDTSYIWIKPNEKNISRQKQYLSFYNINHGTILEIVWTLIPSFILFAIAIPSFALLYSMEEIFQPQDTSYIWIKPNEKNISRQKQYLSFYNINHGTILEIVWTLIPSFILFAIAIPSFALLYSMEEIFQPQDTSYIWIKPNEKNISRQKQYLSFYNINHGTILEIVWTLIPSFILFAIAIPSFALLYSMEEIFQPQDTSYIWIKPNEKNISRQKQYLSFYNINHGTILEIVWTLIPSFILFAIAIPSFALLYSMEEIFQPQDTSYIWIKPNEKNISRQKQYLSFYNINHGTILEIVWTLIPSFILFAIAIPSFALLYSMEEIFQPQDTSYIWIKPNEKNISRQKQYLSFYNINHGTILEIVWTLIPSFILFAIAIPSFALLYSMEEIFQPQDTSYIWIKPNEKNISRQKQYLSFYNINHGTILEIVWTLIPSFILFAIAIPSFALLYSMEEIFQPQDTSYIWIKPNEKNISRQKQYLSFYNINHGTILEIVWTLIPSFILFAIAIPSFALLYSMEEIFQPQDTSYIWIKPNEKNISRQKQYLSFYNINHGTILEIVWTLIPSFILFAIAIPSFALLYSMEEIFQPQDTSYIWIKPNEKNISRQKQYLSFYNINHGTILEIVWTLIPSFILFAIAIPSFALLYSMEEIFQPQDTSYIWIKPNEKNISRQKQYLSFYNINHGTILEIVWTLIPSFILFAIAIPSFALLYSMEEIFQPQDTSYIWIKPNEKNISRQKQYLSFYNINHGTILEIVWTLIPSFILFAIAIPSFALLYSMEEIFQPQDTSYIWIKPNEKKYQ